MRKIRRPVEGDMGVLETLAWVRQMRKEKHLPADLREMLSRTEASACNLLAVREEILQRRNPSPRADCSLKAVTRQRSGPMVH